MHKASIWRFLLICALASVARADYLEPGDHHLTLTSEGVKRPYILYIPKGDSLTPVPLVMMLHGAGGTAENAARSYGWPEKADQEHFAVVFPQGMPPRSEIPANFFTNPNLWNDHRPNIKLDHFNDVAFLAAVLDECQHQANIDPRRIYVTGFSNGASMTFYLATQLSNRIAAIAPVSGRNFATDVTLAHPMPLMFTVGDSDPLNPLNGGMAKNPWGASSTKPAMIDSLKDWLRFDKIDDQNPTTQTTDAVTIDTYGNGSVIFVTIKNQGHEWAGKRRTLPKTLTGSSNMNYDATTAIWNFFKDKTLP